MIEINGKPYHDHKEIVMSALLQQLGYHLNAIIVKHNQHIVKYSQFNDTIVKDGDVLKVFPFAGGG